MPFYRVTWEVQGESQVAGADEQMATEAAYLLASRACEEGVIAIRSVEEVPK